MFVPRVWVALSVAALAALARSDVSIKRIPSGFQGMRGKKSVDYSSLEDGLMQNEVEKIPYFSVPSLRENSNYFANIDPYAYARAQAQLYGYPDKRAPMGFQGMRGKKGGPADAGPLSGYAPGLDELLEKRAPVGFQGMRGKRQFELPGYSYGDKRAPVGFQGMRGKKSALEETRQDPGRDGLAGSFDGDDDALGLDAGPKERRSANYGFLGVRGKKMPSASTFFGMRGKKGPDYPFKGKFVGVRGRRTYQEKPDEIQQLEERLAWNADNFEKRRGPSGFLGMRGKKWLLSGSDPAPPSPAAPGRGAQQD